MAGNTELAREWFGRAVERYRESFPLAPPGSWGRPIGMLKSRILAVDWAGAGVDAAWTLDQGTGHALDTVEAPRPGQLVAQLAESEGEGLGPSRPPVGGGVGGP